MELNEFVAETLRQIIDGVKAAQQHAAENGARVNPHQISYNNLADLRLKDLTSGSIVQEVTFDVGLTVIEGKGTKGGVGVVVGPFVLGSKGETSATNQAVSRIQFKVPVTLPSM